MKYRDDFEPSRARLSAFWERELIDRVCISVFCAGDSSSMDALPDDQADKDRFWLDPQMVIARNRQRFAQTYYAGEAFPQVFLTLGASNHAEYFSGAKFRFDDSVWFEPSLTMETLDDLQFEPDGLYYQKTLELARAYVGDSGGDYFVSMPSCSGDSDALAHLLGIEALLEGMLEEPEAIRVALDKVHRACVSVLSDVRDITRDNNLGGGTIGWMHTWAPGSHAQLQSDMACMISNALFEEFIMPELRIKCDLLDYPLYHMDGMEQRRHLESVLSLEKLRAVQWAQVDGQPDATHFIPVLQQIQAAKKGLVLLIRPWQLEPLMGQLSSKGLHLIVDAQSKGEADEIVRLATKLTHD